MAQKSLVSSIYVAIVGIIAIACTWYISLRHRQFIEHQNDLIYSYMEMRFQTDAILIADLYKQHSLSQQLYIDKILPASVSVSVNGKHCGGGVFIANRCIATVAHLFEGEAEDIAVQIHTYDNHLYDATILYQDSQIDLAFLSIKESHPCYLDIYPAEGRIKPLANLIAVGYPDDEHAHVVLGQFIYPLNNQALITNCPGYFGFSGGPVVDIRTGRLIGLCSLKMGGYCDWMQIVSYQIIQEKLREVVLDAVKKVLR